MQLTSFPTSTILLVFLASLVCMTTADFKVLKYEWITSRGDYVKQRVVDFLTGIFIDDKSGLKLCRRARSQLSTSDVAERFHEKPSFGFFDVKLVQDDRSTPMNLLKCPTHAAPLYIKKFKETSDDTAFLVYQKDESGAGPSNAGDC